MKRFILCLGYKRESFIDYFMNYHARAADVTIRLGKKDDISFHGGHGEEDWEVTLADTGDRTMTGGRIARAEKYLKPDDQEFFLTYVDAVADVDVAALLLRHRSLGKKLTVTAVHLAGRFGEMGMDSIGNVTGFHEKPQTEQGFINGGFMVADRSMPESYLTPSETLIFEQQPKAVRKWLEEEYPEIERISVSEGAEIHWGDETCVMNTDGRKEIPPAMILCGGTISQVRL